MSSYLSHRRKGFQGGVTAFDGFGNRSRSFDGVDDYITAPDGSWLPRGAQTWACWVKYNSSGTYAFFNHNGSSPNRSIQMVIGTDNKIQFQVSADGTNREDFKSVSSLTQGEWYHIACVFNPSASTGQGRRIYINGVLDQNGSTNYTLLHDTNQDVGMGANGAGLFNLDGSLADCRIYDADIGDAGVLDIYNGTNVTTNLVGHWLKDTPSLLDHAGNNDATNYGSKFSYDNPSPAVELGSASRSFNGTSDYINTNASFNNVFNSNFTFACWVKCDDGQPTTTNSIFGNQNNTPVSRFLCGVLSNGARVAYYNVDGNVCITQTQATLSNGQSDWFHFVVTVTPSGNSIYLDGSLQALDATNNGDMSGLTMGDYDNSTVNCFIGARSLNNSPNLYMDGKIADVRIYDTDLTASQVSDLYAGTDVQTNLIGHWLTNNDDVNDYAGVNDGTNFGSTYSYDNPNALVEYGGASRGYNGNINYTDLGNDTSLNITDEIGISVWVRPDKFQNGAILSKWTTGAEDDNSFVVYIGQDQGNDKITFILQPSLGVGSNSFIRCDGNISLSTTEWSHVSCSFDGSVMKLYINGVLDNSVSFTDTIKVTTRKLFIGKLRDQDTLYSFDGNIADVRFYDSALTSTEAYELYKGVDHRTNLIGQWLTNSDDVEDKAGTNDGTNYGSTYVEFSPL